MAYDAKTERLIALKKLSGKAHTSNDKGLANEPLPSGITMSTTTIFASAITTSPGSSSPYQITGNVEFLRLPCSFKSGTNTVAGRHGFEIKLPSDYESSSSNSKKGTYPYINNQVINITSGSLQLIPPSFAPAFEAKPFYGSLGSGTQIPLLDDRDWNLDYFNGVLFQQDPPGTGNHSNNPTYVEAFLYIGDYLNEAGGGSGDITAVVAGTGLSGGANSGSATVNLDINSLAADSNAGNLGDSIAIADASDSNNVKKITLTQLQTLVGAGASNAFKTISIGPDGKKIRFTGNFGMGSYGTVPSSIILRISDGSSNHDFTATNAGENAAGSYGNANQFGAGTDRNANYVVDEMVSKINAGSLNVTAAALAGNTATDASFTVEADSGYVVTVTEDPNSDNSGNFGGSAGFAVVSSMSDQSDVVADSGADTLTLVDDTGIDITSSASTDKLTFAIDNSTVAMLTGSIFSGNIVAQTGLSGSLQNLSDGSSYLIAGSNVTIVSGSTGAITISATGGGSGDPDLDFQGDSGGALSIDLDSETLTIAGGTGVTTVGSGNSLTIATDVAQSHVTSVGTLTSLGITGDLTVDTNTLHVKSSTNKVGIGTTSPAKSLDISGDFKVSGTTTLNSVEYTWPASDGSSGQQLQTNGNGTLSWAAAGTVSGDSGGRDKDVYALSQTTALNNISLGSTDLSTVDYNPNSIDVFLNGMLMHSGSASVVAARGADYYLTGPSTLKFAFDVQADDLLDVVISEGGSPASAAYITFEAHSVLSNERVFRVSEFLSLTTEDTGFIDLDINRKKITQVISSDLTAGNALASGYDFSKVSYSPDRIDVFVNGILLLSGSSRDYYLQPTSNIIFGFDLFIDDHVTINIV